jgi:predicted transcriptional regulator
MNGKTKGRVRADGTRGFFERVGEHARRLDAGEPLPAELTVSFEDPADMLRVLSPGRVRLLRSAQAGPKPVSTLATKLRRDTRAVSRDVALLEQFGLLQTRYDRNPGHGRYKIVETRASRYHLIATI